MEPNGSLLATITTEDDNSRATSSFLERGAVNTLIALRISFYVALNAKINMNPLEKQQQQIVAREERAKRKSETMTRLTSQRYYVFRAPLDKERLKEASGRSIPIRIVHWAGGHFT